MIILKDFSLFIALMIIVVWVYIAANFDFSVLNTTQGWGVISQGVIFGFMFIPKILGQLVIEGVSTLL